MDELSSKINQVGVLEQRVNNLGKMFQSNLTWQDEKTLL